MEVSTHDIYSEAKRIFHELSTGEETTIETTEPDARKFRKYLSEIKAKHNPEFKYNSRWINGRLIVIRVN